MSEFLIQDRQTIVFAGDSITDCGRRDTQRPLGNGYVMLASELMRARYPERNVTFHNAGISGNTVQNLRDRWEDDVLYYQPDWITIKIGINDLHRTLYQTPEATPPDMFETAYRDIITRSKNSGAKICLIDPFYLSADAHEGSERKRVLDMLPEYLSIVHQLAEEFQTLHVPTQELFLRQLQNRPSEELCPEPVHPYTSGHIVIAHGVLQALKW